LTPDDYLEAHRYFSGLARYERRAADIAAALALRLEHEGILPQVDADLMRLLSVRQFWMQKKAEGWAGADGLGDEDIIQELEKHAEQRDKDQR
jgi:hypothetical protein